MKIADLKHNHSLTDLLKIGLFSILMLAPVLSVGVRSLYVICNKNAYQSYSDEISYTSIEDINTGNNYLFNTSSLPLQTYDSGRVDYENIKNVSTNYTNLYNALIDTNNVAFRVYASSSAKVISLYDSSNAQTSFTITNYTISFDFTLIAYNTNNETDLLMLLYKQDKNTLDNVFEYSVNKLADDELFSWTQETAIFTGVKAMTDQLEVNTLAIPVILTYWFLLTVIYVIIDIILKCFTVLTHMIGSKTA